MTSIPAVEAALVAIFAATLTSSQVFYGTPHLTGGRICIVGSSDLLGRVDVSSLGLATFTESYDVPVQLVVSAQGSTLAAVTALVMADFAAAQAAVRDNPTLGVLVGGIAQTTGEFTMVRKADTDGQEADVLFSVSVYAPN